MHFGFALDLSDLVLWNIDLLDPHLDLLETDILSKDFVCLQDVLETSQNMSSRRLQHMYWRCLQHNNFPSYKKSWRTLKDVLRDAFNTSSRRLGRRKIAARKTCRRRVENQQMFAGKLVSNVL